MRAWYIVTIAGLAGLTAACVVDRGDAANGESPLDVACANDAGAPNASSDAAATPPAPSSATPTAPGYFHTDGSKIVDSSGKTVRLTGINWFGMETANFAPHGLWQRGMGEMLDQVKTLGFNVLRVPFSDALFAPGSMPNGIDETKNPDLKGLTGVQIMDKLVAGAKARGLRVFLDRHRPDAGAQSPLWYTDTVSEQTWIANWVMLAGRYKDEPTVIGADLHNEPHGAASWGTGDMATDWRLAAERAGNAIQAVNPNWLVIVEGVETTGGASYWWGGNLRSEADNPVRLGTTNRVVYSTHDYPASVYAQTWFSAPGYPANLAGVFDQNWGSIAKSGQAPILVGEFGTRYASDSDKAWLGALVSYIKDNGLSFTFWCLNPDSGDTGGILKDDWVSVNTDLMNAIAPALAPPL